MSIHTPSKVSKPGHWAASGAYAPGASAPAATPPELVVPGIIPEVYRNFVQHVYDSVKHCSSLAQAKCIRFQGKKPGSLYVCAQGKSIIFFERANNVFAQITFEA